MAAIDFPASPAVGQTFTPANGVTYVWSGTLWLASGASAGGDFYAYANTSVATFGPGSATIIPNTVLTGNSGGWYNTTNGRYTPPAGRYQIMAGAIFTDLGPGGSNASLQIRKNGVAIGVGRETANGGHVLTSTGYFGDPQGSVIVDANGTDFFDVFATTAVSACFIGNYWFSAFPISGIKGPPGDYPSGALFMYSEKVCVGGETFMDVTIPANAKRIELEYAGQPASGTPLFNLQIVQSGVPFAASNYSNQIVYGNGSAAGASGVTSQTSWGISGGSHVAASAKLMPLPAFGWFGTVHLALIQASRYTITYEIDCSATVALTTGFRITLASSSFVVGSFFRAYVVV